VSRILIVDDDPQLGRSLERVLGQAGHDCHVFSDPTLAAKDGASFRPDAILIELQPQYEPALLELRDVFGAIPFVFMTGHHAEFTRLGELIGAYDDWLAKPAAPQELVARLATAMRRARQN
jgi:DNA-binding response OmpR family regulator